MGGDRGGPRPDYEDIRQRMGAGVTTSLPGISQLTPPPGSLQSPPTSLPLLSPGAFGGGVPASVLGAATTLSGLPVGGMPPGPETGYYDPSGGALTRAIMSGVLEFETNSQNGDQR